MNEENKRTTISLLPSTVEGLKINKALCGVKSWDHYFILNMMILNDFAFKYNKAFSEVVAGERSTFPLLDEVKVDELKEKEVTPEIKELMERLVSYSRYPATED